MTRSGYLLLFVLMLFPYKSHCQGIKPVMVYTKIDSIARTVQYQGDICRLTNELTAPYPEKLAKARAIFIWITENIRYDYKFVNKGKTITPPPCRTGANCEAILQDWERNYLDKILRKKKAICSGYSRLFKRMCNLAGIRCEIIDGYTKTKHYQVGTAGSVNHVWNAVWLDSSWQLADATWASGTCEETSTGKLRSFEKQYDDYYWLTSFHDFTRNHYPKDGRWVFEDNYTKEKFANNPFYEPGYISNIQLLSPGSGVITAKKGDTIHFVIKYTDLVDKVQINSNLFRNLAVEKKIKISRRRSVRVTDTFALNKQRYTPFTRNGNRYLFDYVVTDPFLNYVEILFDYRRMLRFRIMVEKI